MGNEMITGWGDNDEETRVPKMKVKIDSTKRKQQQ